MPFSLNSALIKISSDLNSPNFHEEFLYLLQLGHKGTRHVTEAVQSGVHLQHPLPVATVCGTPGVALEWDEGSHPLGSSLDVSDIFSPQNHAFVALFTSRKV